MQKNYRYLFPVMVVLAALVTGCGGGGGGPGFIISQMTPAPDGAVVGSPAELVFTFSRTVAQGSLTAHSVRLVGSGGDGTFDDGNEVIVEVGAITVDVDGQVHVDLSGTVLAPDTYQVVVAGRGAGNALDFDGIDDFASVAGHPAFAPGMGSWTVECWTCLDDTGRSNNPITCADGDFENGWRLIQEPAGPPIDGRFYFVIESEVLGDCAFAVGGDAPIPGDWMHIAGVWDADAGEARFYVNGELVGTGSTGLENPVSPAADIFFGRYHRTSVGEFRFMDGQVDEVRLWNVARTGTEIQRDRFSVPSNNETGLVGCWSFDENGGQLANDLTQLGNDAVLGADGNPGNDDPTRVDSGAWPIVRDENGNALDGGRNYVVTFTVN